jgi:hypothetical protein
MNFFDDLFNSTITLPSDKNSEMLDIDLYWQIIENSLETADTLEQQEENLIEELSFLAAEDIIGFKLRTDYFMSLSYQNELWCAASIMNETCDYEGFKKFRAWLISQGKNIYTEAMIDPDRLSHFFDEGFNEDDLYEFECFLHIPEEIFITLYNQNIHNYIDYENFKYLEDLYPEMELTWNEEEISTLQLICPKLFTIFFENISTYDDDDDDEEDRSDEFDIE